MDSAQEVAVPSPALPDGGPTSPGAVDGDVPRSVRIARFTVDYGVYIATLGVLVAGALFVDNFGTVGNLTQILRSISFVGVVAVGMTFVVVGGSFVDLSVAAQISAASLTVLALQDQGILVAVVGAVLVASAFGAVNGLLVGGLRGNAVIITLGLQTAGTGVVWLASGGRRIDGSIAGALDRFGDWTVAGVPATVIVFILVAVAGHVLLSATSFGHSLQAVGANRDAARAAGAPVGRRILQSFVLMGVANGVAGILLAAFSNTADATMGEGFEFDALTAVILGGAALAGGSADMRGTVTGAVLLGAVKNLLILAGVPFEWQLLVVGLLVVVAVGVSSVARKAAR